MTLVALVGCTQPTNPSFPLSHCEAQQALEEMRDRPKALVRPLVVIGGFLDVNISPPLLSHFFHGVTSKDALIIPVSVGLCGSFDECRRRVLEAVDRACPTNDARYTVEVDVVGASLGGLVARYAAAPARGDAGGRRLKVARLFTISSPHSGATLATSLGFTSFHHDMLPDSAFLRGIAAHDVEASYQLIAYVHLGDGIVGARYAAPPGVTPYWLANDSLLLPHFAAMMDARILADIARRLRDEAPFALSPPTPLPGSLSSSL